MRTEIKADSFKIYPPEPERNDKWEICFYNKLGNHLVIITLDDITKFRESLEETKKRTK